MEYRREDNGLRTFIEHWGFIGPMVVVLLVCLFFLRPNRHSKGENALDVLLEPGRVDQVNVINEVGEKTNSYSGSSLQQLLQGLSKSNRSDRPITEKSLISGSIELMKNGDRKGRLYLFPREKVLGFEMYEFLLKSPGVLTEFIEAESTAYKANDGTPR